VNPISRAILIVIAFLAGAPLPVYVGIWFVTDLGGDLFQWFLAWRELRRQGLHAGIRPTLKPTDLPGDRFNVAPTDPVAAVVEHHGERVVDTFRWGLVPFFADSAKGMLSSMDAKVDTSYKNPNAPATPAKKKK